MKSTKKTAPRRAGIDPETKAAHDRLCSALYSVDLDLESLEIVERLVAKLASRSLSRRR